VPVSQAATVPQAAPIPPAAQNPQTAPAAPEPPAAENAGDRQTPEEKPVPLEELEKNAILAALERSGGNRTKAAEELGITRKTIGNKLRSYGV
jgi:DNA-binding NtrC family response regulator